MTWNSRVVSSGNVALPVPLTAPDDSTVTPQPFQPGEDHNMKINYAALLKLIPLIPYVFAGIRELHKDAAHETHVTLATNSLVLASGVADAVDPKDQETIDCITNAVASIVHGVAKLHNSSAPEPTPEPAP